jgi:hypothetical protein
MKPSSRCFPNAVLFQTRDPGSKAFSAGTTLRCSAQAASAARVVRIGGLHPETTHVVSFAAFPLDASAGARAATSGNRLGPECNAQDLLTWSPPDGPPRKLQALAPCRTVAGRRAIFQVDCKAIA